MTKIRTIAAAAVAAAVPVFLLPTAQALAGTGHGAGQHAGTFWDQTQTLAGQQATFDRGGSDAGRGAAELVSSAYLGGPQAILDIPAHVLGLPKPLEYVPTLPMMARQGSVATPRRGAAGHQAGTFWDQTQTLAGQQATFIKGGSDAGRGAAELVSSAYLGGPQAILDIPAHVLGLPKPLEYLP